MLKKILKNKKATSFVMYGLSFFVTLIIMLSFVGSSAVREFFVTIENKTFDFRQSLIADSKSKVANKDIVIITIDDASYEYILDKYGEWPLPRDVYAKIVDYIELQNPQSVAFDLMFVKSLKSKANADAALVKSFYDYDNLFTSMNLDNQSYDLRKPVNLPDKFTVNLKNAKFIDENKVLNFQNCRSILPAIMAATKNVGMINVARADDGIIRKMPLFMVYQGKVYPHLAFLIGLDYLKKNEGIDIGSTFEIDDNNNFIVGNRKIPLDEGGNVVLNWYGPSDITYKYIPMYKLIKLVNGEKLEENEFFDFKNKIVYFGSTAVSLYDTKSVPVDKLYPGVEMHTTLINNLIDNNFIRIAPERVNILIALALALIVGFVVVRVNSAFVAMASTLALVGGYIVVAYYIMKFFNIWIAIILPLLAVGLIFVVAFIVKYLIKSRDFEHQYKLATTDGLTDLYNHRYFQDQMRLQIDTAKRYNTQFSLIIIDIDFFKKFNDTYGHQAGDAVLRQVAQTLKKNVRSTDVVCRYGGEEMSIILPNTDKQEATITAQKICQAVSVRTFKLNAEDESNVTISLGVATYPQDGVTPQELIEKSDNGLYYAKEHGRNQVGIV